MNKVIKKVPVWVEDIQDKEMYVTTDGVEFENELDAIEHENLQMIKEIDISKLLPSNNKSGNIVWFENERQIEIYEQRNCGNKDDNTWGSWVSQKDKFENLPKWIVCYYEYHASYDDSYTAFYYTLEEFKSNLDRMSQVVIELM